VAGVLGAEGVVARSRGADASGTEVRLAAGVALVVEVVVLVGAGGAMASAAWAGGGMARQGTGVSLLPRCDPQGPLPNEKVTRDAVANAAPSLPAPPSMLAGSHRGWSGGSC